MVTRRKTTALLVTLMVLIGMMAQAATVAGPDPAPGVPPNSKTVVSGSLIGDPDLVYSTKPLTMGTKIVINAPYPAPGETYDVLMRGGNFFDASIAFQWMTMWGGDQFFGQTAIPGMYNGKEHRASAHMGLGTNPFLINLDLVRNVLKLQVPPNETDMGGVGAWIRAGVLPEPDSMIAILDRYGTMSWKQATAGIYETFMDGIPALGNYVRNARRIFTNANQNKLPIYVETRAYWGQLGPSAKEGALLKVPGAARIIREMAEAEDRALASGLSRHQALQEARDEFYKGNFAKAIDQFSRDTGGYTRWSDYASYKGYWIEQEEMIHTTFMGIDFYADSPSSQGPCVIMVLNMIEAAKEVYGKSIQEMGYMTPEYIHFFTSCIDLSFADRWWYFGDPKFVDVPKQLFTKEYAKLRVALIDPKKHFDRIPPAGDPRNMKAVLAGYKEWTLPPKVAGGPAQDLAQIPDESRTDTTQGGMIDKDGNVFCYTPSDPGPMVPGYQIHIGARDRQFTYDPALPSCIAPGKRPETTPHAWVASKDGEGYMYCQTSGGDEAPMASIQTVLNFLVWNMNPQVAIEQPKVATNNYMSWFTPHIQGYYAPGEIELPRGVPNTMNTAFAITAYPPKATTDALTAMGAKVGVGNYPGPGYGLTMAVRDPVTKVILGGSAAWTDEDTVSWGR